MTLSLLGRPLPRLAPLTRLTTRTISTTPRFLAAFGSGPSPLRLPPDQQAEFERLQKASRGAFSQPSEPAAEATSSTPQVNQTPTIDASQEGEVLHPNVRRGAPPEFEGDVNPKTGEVGGPKNDPLKWKGDWSYNGRVTDF